MRIIRNFNFDPAKGDTENTTSGLYFNEESDYSEENTSDTDEFRSNILQPFQKKRVKESHEKETTEAVVRRYSSK